MPRTFTPHPITRRALVNLCLVLIAAAVMRFAYADSVEFFHDEAMVSMMAQELSDGQNFPTIGIVSSVGIPNPPTGIYLMALPYAFTDNPLIVTMFIAALNVVGVGLLWGIAHRYGGPLIALAAGLAYALNPWAVMYSRKIWAQDFHTPLILLGVALGLLGFVENRRWAQVLCLPVLLFAMQIHFAAWALLPLYGVLLWRGRGTAREHSAAHEHSAALSWRTLALTLLLSVLVVAPYTVGLLDTFANQPDLLSRTIERTSGTGGSSGTDETGGITITADALMLTASLVTGTGIENWLVPVTEAVPDQQSAFLAQMPPFMPLWWIFGGLALVGLVALWLNFPRWWALLVTLWVGVPLLAFSVTWTTVYAHYFAGSLPAYALLTGTGTVALIRAGRVALSAPLSRTLILTAFAALALTQGWWWFSAMRYLDRTPIALGAGTSGYTTPVRVLLDVVEAVREVDDVVVISAAQWVHFDAEAARFPVMLRDAASCVRTLPPDGFMVLPDHPFAVVTAPDAKDSPVSSLYGEVDGGTGREIPSRGQETYSVRLLDAAPVPDLEFTTVEPVPFANGVTLNGYALTQERIYLLWHLPDAPSREFYASLQYDLQYFLHLLDANDGLTEQKDLSFWAGRHWCAGDRLVSWVDVTGVDDAHVLRTGFYTLAGEGETVRYLPVDVLDTMGNPAGNWADIPLR